MAQSGVIFLRLSAVFIESSFHFGRKHNQAGVCLTACNPGVVFRADMSAGSQASCETGQNKR